MDWTPIREYVTIIKYCKRFKQVWMQSRKGYIDSMNCRNLQKRIIPFIDDQLSIEELDGFLHHLDCCESCREEYDVYYTMIMGMRYLDEKENISEFHIDSEEKLRSAADYLMKYRILHLEKIMLFAVLCFGAVLLL